MKGTTALLRQNLDKSCWDGNWYLRAFYDDGTPLGSHKSEECRIDLLSQSFAVFAGMPDASRVQTALDSALDRLVDHEGRIVKLFTPPFDRSDHNPGYIKAYPTGIRENGGQYTHAAIWLALALLEAGRAEEGWRLLDMLNPASRCTDAALAQSYKTEPYYLAADIYTHAGCCGHGGWSIYTGAAAWYYRAVVGGLLGLGFHGRGAHPFAPPARKLEPFLGYGTGGGGDLRDRMLPDGETDAHGGRESGGGNPARRGEPHHFVNDLKTMEKRWRARGFLWYNNFS